MKQIKTKEWANVLFKTLPYEKQTQMKHQVLKYYFPQWLQILSSWNNNINYIDGFGGIGAYHTDDDIKTGLYGSNNFGSPVFSVKIINDLKTQYKIKNANVLIIEKKQNNIRNIKKILEYENISIGNSVQFIAGDFDKEINNLLDNVKNLAPTFFLIDPFGYSLKLDTIKRIMNNPRSELVLNFMYNAIQRWIKNPKVEERFTELFGNIEWKKFADENIKTKEDKLVGLFRTRCQEFAKYVYPFKLSFPNKKRPYYYLFHLCNHPKGCSLMKASFAKFNKGDTEYLGESCQRSLFDENLDKIKSCTDKLINIFSGRSITYKKLISETIGNLRHTESDIRKTLQQMEKEDKIKINSNGRKRLNGFIEKDIIIFP